MTTNNTPLWIRGTLMVSLFLSVYACQKYDFDKVVDESSLTLDQIKFPENFDFSATREVEISLMAPDFLSHAVFAVFSKHNDSLVQVAKGSFGTDRKFLRTVSIPAYIDSLVVLSKSFGLEKVVWLEIMGGKVFYNYGTHYEPLKKSAGIFENFLKSAQVDTFSFLGTYTAAGAPTYLYQVNDPVWQSLIQNLDQTLPEGIEVDRNNPGLINPGNEFNLVLKQQTKVYNTFAGEGTSNTNSLGYFIYDGTKPSGEQHTIIFPNASLPSSGGALKSGDKVLIGDYQPNTVIGWFLVPQGWDNNLKIVRSVDGIFYSLPGFNSSTNPAENQQMILLHDEENEVLVICFEDTKKGSKNSDRDFNDVVFYVTLENLKSADLSNIPKIQEPVDTDGDGIIDVIDEYPANPDLAFNNSALNGSTGTLAFEDLWPAKGDYDFNDLVLEYHFNPVTDADNRIKVLEINLNITNIGASYRNGFGIELPVSPSLIQSVTGTRITGNYLSLAGNGTENGQPKAVIFPFDEAIKVSTEPMKVSITFTDPLALSDLGSFPFNPFLVVNGTRGREIHLPDYPPTAKADASLFRQANDYSRPEKGLYYRTSLNMPWAINIPGTFTVPMEKSSLNLGYLKFVDWAKSAGTDFQDWYVDLPGYRNKAYLK